MATSSEKTESALRSISMCWLVQALFTKYAPKFADKVNWKEFAACGKEERKNLVSSYKSRLREKSPGFHNDLCGALNIIMIAVESRKIKGFMRKMISGKGTLVKRFNHEALRKVIGDGQPSEPANIATWFCIHEEDLPSEANKIKQLALAEEQRYYNWSWYNITPPTKTDENEEKLLGEFEKELKKIFRSEKDDKKFAVKAWRLDETKTFVRYCVSTTKDPIETFLAKNGSIDRGNDPTANTFLIDHFFSCDMIRVTFPEVIDTDRIAILFAKHFLGCDITAEEPKIFLGAMRKYATEKECSELIEQAKLSSDIVKDIRLKAMRFTIAENATLAEARRISRENKKRVAEGLPPLPRLRCEVYENDNIFAELRRSFSENAQRKELLDVFELVFNIELFKPQAQDYLAKELKDGLAPFNRYALLVSPRSVRFKPRWQEVADASHRDALRKIQSALKLSNDLALDVIKGAAR